MARKRVVVTGLGMLSPVGSNVSSTWNKIIEGSSGVKAVSYTHLTLPTKA